MPKPPRQHSKPQGQGQEKKIQAKSGKQSQVQQHPNKNAPAAQTAAPTKPQPAQLQQNNNKNKSDNKKDKEHVPRQQQSANQSGKSQSQQQKQPKKQKKPAQKRPSESQAREDRLRDPNAALLELHRPSRGSDDLGDSQPRPLKQPKVVFPGDSDSEDEGKEPEVRTEPTILEQSLAGALSVSDFLRHVWGRKALVVRHLDPAADYIDWGGYGVDLVRDYVMETQLDLQEMMENTASDSLHVWMANPRKNGKIDSFQVDGDNTKAAATLHSHGASLYFRAPEEISAKLVQHMSAALGLDWAVLSSTSPRGEVETFVSRAGHVTDWHFDFMENFTYQLKGSKRWLFKRSTIAHPIRGSTSHYLNIDTAEQQNKLHHLQDPKFSVQGSAPKPGDPEVEAVEISEGDFMYHPAGIWHRVECSADSISINVSLMPLCYADLIAQGLRQRLSV